MEQDHHFEISEIIQHCRNISNYSGAGYNVVEWAEGNKKCNDENLEVKKKKCVRFIIDQVHSLFKEDVRKLVKIHNAACLPKWKTERGNLSPTAELISSRRFFDTSSELSSLIKHSYYGLKPSEVSYLVHSPCYHKTRTSSFHSLSSIWTLSGTSDTFIKEECYDLLAKKLHPKNNLTVRLNILKQLQELISTELVPFDLFFTKFKSGLRLCLKDVNVQIFDLALKIHVKLLFSGMPSMIHEGFNNIASVLESFFINKSKACFNAFNVRNVKIKHTLLLLRAAVNFLKSFTSHWIRHSSSSIKDIMNSFLGLLNVHFPVVLNSSNTFCPFTFVAVLDPNASWVKHWLKSSFGRNLLKQVLVSHKSFLHKVVLACMNSIKIFAHSETTNQRVNQDFTSLDLTYSSQSLRHLGFIHLLSMIQEFLLYRSTEEMLLECSNETRSSILKQSLKILRLKCSCNERMFTSVVLCPSAITSNLCSEIFNRDFRLFSEIFPELLHLCRPNSEGGIEYCNGFHILEIFAAMFQHDNILNAIGADKIQLIFEIIQQNLVDFRCSGKEPKDHQNHLSLAYDLSLKIISQPKNLIKFMESELFETFVISLNAATLNGIYQKIMSSYLGITALVAHSRLDDFIDCIYPNSNDVSSNWNFQLSELSVHYHGCRILASPYCIMGFWSGLWDNYVKQPKGNEICFEPDQTFKWYVNVFCSMFPNIITSRKLSHTTFDQNDLCCDIFTFLDKVFMFYSCDGNYKSTCTFLILLNILITSIHTTLMLQSKYNISEEIFRIQSTCVADDHGAVSDQLSSLLKHVVTRTLLVGGPSERTLPSMELPVEGDKHFQGGASLDELLSSHWQFCAISESGVFDVGSFRENCRQIFSSNAFIYNDKFKDLLLQAVQCDPIKDIRKDSLDEFDVSKNASEMFGIRLAIRYGKNLKLIQQNDEHICRELFKVLSIVKEINPKEEACDFDCLVASVFLLMKGDTSATLNFFESFNELSQAKYLWHPWRSMSISSSTEASHISLAIKSIMDAELNEVLSAFNDINYSPSNIIHHWLYQMFWSYLDMPQIAQVILLVLHFGGDYLLYFIISIFKHMESDIFHHHHDNDLAFFLKTEAIKNFNALNHLEFMESLCITYRTKLSSTIGQCL